MGYLCRHSPPFIIYQKRSRLSTAERYQQPSIGLPVVVISSCHLLTEEDEDSSECLTSLC
jgi:hypothetical protein